MKQNSSKYVCPFECMTFQSYRNYLEHLQLHVLQCHQCQVVFENGDDLVNHVTSHKDDTNLETNIQWMCSFCGEMQENIASLNFHERNHKEIDLLTCQICKMQFDSFHMVLNHLKNDSLCSIKLKKSLFTCIVCDQTFLFKTDLNKHKMTHKEFKCDKCDRVFKKSQYLRVHKETHSKVMGFVCPICEKPFRRKYNMEQHISVHTTDNPCKICCSSFITDLHLQQHLTNHTEEEIDIYDAFTTVVNCHECNKNFISKLKLFLHFKEAHLKTENYECDICKHFFKTAAILETHRKSHASKINCSTCNKQFANQKTLIEHVRIHTGDKPFACDFCNKTFRCQSNLYQHRLKHLQTRKLKCTFCPAQFNRSNTLREHLRIHFNQKPYECVVCERRFTQRSVMKKHMTKIHQKCDICNKIVGDKMKMMVHLWKMHRKENRTSTSTTIMETNEIRKISSRKKSKETVVNEK